MAGPYYVDVTTGDDGDSGLSEALAFATLGFAANTIAAGEICYVKASASYTADDPDTATTNWEITTVGTATAPIVWIGYTTVITDGGVVTVDAQDTNTSALLMGSGAWYNMFKNFHFTQADGAGVDGGGVADSVTFKNCRSSNNAGPGFYVDNGCLFEGCVADLNTGYGIDSDLFSILIGCVAANNSSAGFFITSGVCYVCMSYKNASDSVGFAFTSTEGASLLSCIADCDNGATSTGFKQRVASAMSTAVVNCIFFDCNIGCENTSDCGELVIARNNLFYSNTTNRTNWLTGEGDVTGSSDPFTDSNGEDYSLKSGSEAIDAGYDASQAVSDWGL